MSCTARQTVPENIRKRTNAALVIGAGYAKPLRVAKRHYRNETVRRPPIDRIYHKLAEFTGFVARMSASMSNCN